MAKNIKMDAEVKVRLKSDEKNMLKATADEAGISVSDYVRNIIFSDKKLVLLTEGSEIAKSLFLIHSDLEYLRNSGGIPEQSAEAITGALNNVSERLCELTEKLSDIHANDEEVSKNE